jgi:hypothetical protein
MDVKVRCCPLGQRAADNSIIPEHVVREYLESEDYKRSIATRSTLGCLTHKSRGVDGMPTSAGDPSVIKKKIGDSDQLLLVADGISTPTHYVSRFYIEETEKGNFLSADVHILDEENFDERAAENIKRLKGFLKSGIFLANSLVVVAWWSGADRNNGGADIAKKIKLIKSLDWTLSPSFGPDAHITEIIYDDKEKAEFKDKYFSSVDEENNYGIRVKTFSNPSDCGIDVSNTPKTSKIDVQFTKLKVKEFSYYGNVKADNGEEGNTEMLIEKEFAEPVQETQETQKEFTQAGIRDQLREKKLSPRLCFRRMIISYKQVVRAMGGVEKISPEDLSILKSMLTSDVLFLLNRISDDVINKNKRINVLLGCSSISKSLRLASENLNYIYRMSGIQSKKAGFLQKNYYTKLQKAWNDFVGACIEEVFGANSNNIPEEEIEEIKEEK